MGMATAAGIYYAGLAIVRSIVPSRATEKTEQFPEAFELTGGFLRFPSSGSRAWVLLAIGLLAVWLSSEYWASSKRKEVNKIYTQDIEKGHEEVQAALEAAAQPHAQSSIPKVNAKQGFVYLGQCDKYWIPGSGRFTKLPPCTEPIAVDGFRLISRKGDVIRASLPETINGKRQLGLEVGRVSAGYSVVLRKMVPVSVFSSGPQYYWGLVDFPADGPAEH